RVLRAVVRRTAPCVVAFTETQPQQVLVAIGHAGETDFVLPTDPALYGGLRRIMILAPVVAAGEEVIENRGTERVVPTHAEHFAVSLRVVIVGIEAGQDRRCRSRPRATLRTGDHKRPVDTGVAGDA